MLVASGDQAPLEHSLAYSIIQVYGLQPLSLWPPSLLHNFSPKVDKILIYLTKRVEFHEVLIAGKFVSHENPVNSKNFL